MTEKHGGAKTEANEWALRGLIALIEQSAADSWGTAAITYLACIATMKPFPDKNEQVALMAAEVFLNLNGKTLSLTESEAWLLTRSIAAGRLGKDELSNALNGKIKELPNKKG